MNDGAICCQAAFLLFREDFMFVARIFWVVGSVADVTRLDTFYFVGRLILKTKWIRFVALAVIDFCLIVRHRRDKLSWFKFLVYFQERGASTFSMVAILESRTLLRSDSWLSSRGWWSASQRLYVIRLSTLSVACHWIEDGIFNASNVISGARLLFWSVAMFEVRSFVYI